LNRLHSRAARFAAAVRCGMVRRARRARGCGRARVPDIDATIARATRRRLRRRAGRRAV